MQKIGQVQSPFPTKVSLHILRACLHGGARSQVGGIIRLSIKSLIKSPHLSWKRDQIQMSDCMDRRVAPLKRVTSPTWGPPPPCKQALIVIALSYVRLKRFYTSC